VVRLDPPALPLAAAVTVIGSLQIDSAAIDGRDQRRAVDPAGDDCGPWRDTSSVDAVEAVSVTTLRPPTLYGATWSLALSAQDSLRALFDRAWPVVVARSAAPMRTADSAVVQAMPWRASVMSGSARVTLGGMSDVHGVLAIDGDLVVHGVARITGVLLVRGALDARDGELEVHGALLVRDAAQSGNALGPRARVRYEPCVVGRALAAVSLPRVAPFALWQTP
jgi:hypothetical protein